MDTLFPFAKRGKTLRSCILFRTYPGLFVGSYAPVTIFEGLMGEEPPWHALLTVLFAYISCYCESGLNHFLDGYSRTSSS